MYATQAADMPPLNAKAQCRMSIGYERTDLQRYTQSTSPEGAARPSCALSRTTHVFVNATHTIENGKPPSPIHPQPKRTTLYARSNSEIKRGWIWCHETSRVSARTLGSRIRKFVPLRAQRAVCLATLGDVAVELRQFFESGPDATSEQSNDVGALEMPASNGGPSRRPTHCFCKMGDATPHPRKSSRAAGRHGGLAPITAQHNEPRGCEPVAPNKKGAALFEKQTTTAPTRRASVAEESE